MDLQNIVGQILKWNLWFDNIEVFESRMRSFHGIHTSLGTAWTALQ